MTATALAERRRLFAAEIKTLASLRTDALVSALATIPREQFLPKGPWTLRSEADFGGPPRTSPDDDPRHVYDNVSVAIDAGRSLFNGAPALVCRCIDALSLEPGARVLHVGCALGYYTAVIAHIVGPRGRVIAIEVDPNLAAGARLNLESMPWVEVQHGDATAPLDASLDAILVHAGVTHPRDAWLDALEAGGRLVLPLTATLPGMGSMGKGLMMLLTRRSDGWFAAQTLTFVAIYSAIGLRDAALNQQIGLGLMKRQFAETTWLRRDPHEPGAACRLHTDAFCLSA